jgi:phage terminase large subunit GpA-like protein
MTNYIAYCFSVLRHAVAPRRALSVSQWADEHRILSAKQSSERGRWRTSRNPIMREIMDCFSVGSKVRDVAIMKSSQVGVTEAVVNAIGYTIHHAPAPMMVLMPTIEARDTWKAQKLNPLLLETPVIRDIIGGLKGRDSANRLDMIDFPGGVLFLAGGNSANSYAQKSVAKIILDDLDRFPEEIGEEGDIITLAEGRTKAFPRSIRCYISTPTVNGGLIHRLFEKGDQRRYHVPCQYCGEMQPLEWGGPDVAHGLKWHVNTADDGTRQVVDVWYVCRACGGQIREHHKPKMLAAGEWRPTFQHRDMRSYHISALYAPIGLGPSWKDLVSGWLSAQESTATLRAFINTQLGEPWQERGDEVEAFSVMTRTERYPDEMPRRLRTVGIDVQKDRLEMSVYDWGPAEECWAIDHVIVSGDTAGPEPWKELALELDAISPDFGAIDSGYNADQVVEFAHRRRWLFVCKGVEGRGMPLIEDDETRRRRLRKKRKTSFSPFLVSDYAAKAILMQRLKLSVAGPGYIHFPDNEPAFDEEFFAQLTSNKLVERTVRGRLVREWVQTRVRNEAYDCWKYAIAALRLSKVDPAAFITRHSRHVEEVSAPVPVARVAGRRSRYYIAR